MTIGNRIDIDGDVIRPHLKARLEAGNHPLLHDVALVELCTARVDTTVTLRLTAGQAEQLADTFADLAEDMRARDRAYEVTGRR